MIIGKQSGLGRGLSAMIPPRPPQASPSAPAVAFDDEVEDGMDAPAPGAELRELDVALIDPNPHQPREHFDHQGLEELVASIKEHGVMQPIVVVRVGDRYQLIAGERRLRASKLAERQTIPAIVREPTGDQQQLELALIENIIRRDLNPVEEARAYLRLQSDFNLTQDQISDRVGKSRPQIANIIRLLQLSKDIQDALMQGLISSSHARTLLSLTTDDERTQLFKAMLEGNFTVRQTEARIPRPTRQTRKSFVDPNVLEHEQRLREALGVKVVIRRDPRGEGEVRIQFFNDEDLKGIIVKIVGETDAEEGV